MIQATEIISESLDSDTASLQTIKKQRCKTMISFDAD